MRFVFLIIVLFLFTTPAHCMDYVWMIGGGSEPDNSQISIEKNVIWINSILEQLPGERKITVFYNDGNDSQNDVVQTVKRNEKPESMQPLARVFGQNLANNKIYRNNNLLNSSFSTRKENLLKSLEEEFSAVTEADRVLIIFNGHGLKADKEEDGNAIRVWGNGLVTVRELERLLSIIPAHVPIRFVFPQCYSGGFFRLVNTDAGKGVNLANSIRCGFFAESENRESEG